MLPIRHLAALLPVLLAVTSAPVLAASAEILVLSNRADLISGGDALVEVVMTEGGFASIRSVRLNGRDVSDRFARRGNGRYMGLLTGLDVGRNEVSVQLAAAPAGGGGSGGPGGAPSTGGPVAKTTIINHPNGGPVFSGPQLKPWVCQGTAVDAQCNQPPEYTFFYKSTDPTRGGLQPYDPDQPAADVAETTTDEGVTVPFIVRQERGYQARDEYKILMLWQPGQDWTAWSPQEQWNGKILVTHGGNCGTDYATGSAPLGDASGTIPANPLLQSSYITALGRGFGVMSTALDNLGHNCALATAAESLMMAKERIVEQYGELRYTIGTGCSGGSITQQWVANAYPGIYQGLITYCAYPDVVSTGLQFADLNLMRDYFENPSRWSPDAAWSPHQFGFVEGHATHLNAMTSDELFFGRVTNPSSACKGTTDAERYDRQNNPAGVRCSVMDYNINMLGPRPPERWSEMEKVAGRGFAGIPMDNTGVQYGLVALREGKITPAQFVDLNVKIGGYDVDFRRTGERLVGDVQTIANTYRGGGVNVTNNLSQVAIINFTGPDPGAAHDSVHAWWTRWRLDREQGHHDNHVMWGGPVALLGDPTFMESALLAMDRWLTAVEADGRDLPLADRIIQGRPADVHDQCTNGSGVKLLDTTCPDEIGTVYETPRGVAGDVITAETLKCRLRPFSRTDDYGAVPFTEEQWQKLEAVFADGVCDYGQPAVGFQRTIPWLTYQDANGGVVYGGTPMQSLPVGSGGGRFSRAFTYTE